MSLRTLPPLANALAAGFRSNGSLNINNRCARFILTANGATMNATHWFGLRTIENRCEQLKRGCIQRKCVAINSKMVAPHSFSLRNDRKMAFADEKGQTTTENAGERPQNALTRQQKVRIQRKCVGFVAKAGAMDASQLK